MSDENTVMAQAIKSFEGEEGFKSPTSEPFPVARQRFADLKANGLVVDAADVGAPPEQVAEAEATSQQGDPADSKPARAARSK